VIHQSYDTRSFCVNHWRHNTRIPRVNLGSYDTHTIYVIQFQ